MASLIRPFGDIVEDTPDMIDFSTLDTWLDARKEDMVAFQAELVKIPALAPENGGDGEQIKAEKLAALLEGMGCGRAEWLLAPDSRVSSGSRPNIVFRRSGRCSDRTVWIMTHTDVVPEGDRSQWTSDPYQLRREGDVIYGRGTEDNHHGLTASVFAYRALLEAGIVPEVGNGLLFVADEETGSIYGAQYLLREHAHLFGPDDQILVPDSGNIQGTLLEVAEKSVMWVRCHVRGKQCHASRPYKGINAFVAAASLVMKLRGLYQAFPQENSLFDPPYSTFEPTRKEANVPNINTIPGEDVFFLDCRVMPGINLEEVMSWMRARADEVERQTGVKITFSLDQSEQAAPETPADSALVKAMQQAVRQVHGVEAIPMGIGGGTVAAHFRRAGFPAVVWSTVDELAHQPNEYCRLDNLIKDAKVFVRMLAGA